MQGGSALLMTTKPCFKLEIFLPAEMDKSNSSEKSPPEFAQPLSQLFHADSPAGRWVHKNSSVLSRTYGQWSEAYGGRGGFGASTAQFLAVWLYTQFNNNPSMQEAINDEVKNPRSSWIQAMLKDYWSCSWTGLGQRPSGADLVSQFYGGLLYFNSEEQVAKKRVWPWEQLDIYLVSTGSKLATHQHLMDLQPKSFDDLKVIFSKAEQAFDLKNSLIWLEEVQKFSNKLQSMGLTSEKSVELIRILNQSGLFLVAKACGAMGADVIFCVIDKKNRSPAEQCLTSLGLLFWRNLSDLSEGTFVEARI